MAEMALNLRSAYSLGIHLDNSAYTLDTRLDFAIENYYLAGTALNFGIVASSYLSTHYQMFVKYL